MIEKLTIIGGGSRGASLARAVRGRKLAQHLVIADKDPAVCQALRAHRIADDVTSDIGGSVVGSDLVVIAVPIAAYRALGGQIGHLLKPGAVVTDMAEVKQSTIESLLPFIPASVDFVPAHPLIGADRAGIADRFSGRWCIITPLPQVSLRAVEKISAFWESCGARIEVLNPAHHDMVMAMTAHVPHLVAYAMVDTAANLDEDVRAAVIKFAGGGFDTLARMVDANPQFWRDIFLGNRKTMLEALKRFQQDLTALQKAVRRGDADFLMETFERTQAVRRSITAQDPPGSASPPAAADAAA